ncbi:MAG: GspE/PulE family protein [Candidatus Magasanikbacteria bacterium]
MSNFPSINDLIKESKGAVIDKDKSAVQAQFHDKMKSMELQTLEKMVATQAVKFGLPHIDLALFPVSADALRAIPEEIARAKKIVCFYYTPESIKVGCVHYTPDLDDFIFQLGERHHASVELFLISEHSLEAVLHFYSNLPIVKPVTKDIVITDEEINRYQISINNLKSIEQQFSNVSMTDILTLMVAAALKINASDIHIEAKESGIVVRYRVDGILHDVARLPIEQWKKFVSRIKLLAALKMNVTDRPQDGRVTLQLPKYSLDVRVSTLPTIYGESVVMRILHSGNKGVTYDELGLRGRAYVALKREIERPNGMIITTGPTGSGKTTTMYAIMNTLNKPGVKIITLEDPIEIKMEGINQSQVDLSKDYTFSKGLRSILRQDPDICMVGEIRDLESAEIAIQSALTGHLMLSTVHTNSASGAVPRFLSMGVKSFLLAPALNAVIGQRLVRRICPKCIEEQELDSASLERVGKIMQGLPKEEQDQVATHGMKFYHGKGCEACSGLGYKGRIGIYEIFSMTKEIEQVILSNQVSEYLIQDLAVKGGMVTMAQDGILKALDQITTVEEVLRVAE